MKSSIISLGLGVILVLTLCGHAPADIAQESAMNSFDPATVMPTDTKVYVELGSPGQQLETILNLFEGTPLEDSLTTLLSQHRNPGQGPAKIIQGFMNPSMIAEFKKTQGAAIGLTSINEDMPEFVAVLAPGKSDALRGIIVAAISMAGVPTESVEGMQAWAIDDVVRIAYDGTVFIAGNCPEKFQEAIVRYKNPSPNASLASTTLFKQTTTHRQRAANVITAWVDGKQTYQEISKRMQAEGDTEELAIFNMIADPTHIQRLLLQLSLQDNDIVLDADLTLDEEHQCHAYNLIQTPALSSQGLAMLPADTIALASFSLGAADSPAAEKVQAQLKQITGLDIGREIFANIEQVNIFAVDPQQITDMEELPVATLGIAITSKDSKKTKDLLDTLFQTAYQSMQTSPELKGLMTRTDQGQYAFSINGVTLNCHLEQKENITILSPSKEIINKCFRASEHQDERAAAGSLKSVFEDMPSITNKWIVVNAGGLMRAMDKIIMMENQNPFNPAHKQLNDFSKSLDGMNLCVRMSEEPTRCNLNISINDIPALGPLFPGVMALAEADFDARGCATNPLPCHQGSIAPNRPYQLQWNPGIGSQSHRVYFGTAPSELKLLEEVADSSTINGPAIANNIETYYWRVDETMPDGTVITGDVWNFSMGKMIAHWTLDETSGVVAKDASGQKHDGVLTNQPAWCPAQGIHAGAIRFDGKDDAVEIKDLSVITNTATLTAWINGWKAGDWTGIVFARTWQPCGMHFGENNTLHYTWNNNSAQTYTWNGGPAIPQDEWAFVAIVIKPDKTIAYVYDETNGFRWAENNVPNMPQNIHDLKIGCDTEQGNRYFKGLMDDVRIYNYDLSQEEVKSLTQTQTAAL